MDDLSFSFDAIGEENFLLHRKRFFAVFKVVRPKLESDEVKLAQNRERRISGSRKLWSPSFP